MLMVFLEDFVQSGRLPSISQIILFQIWSRRESILWFEAFIILLRGVMWLSCYSWVRA